MNTEPNIGDGAELLALILGLLIAVVIDAIVFGIIAAIPAAALLIVGLISNSGAIAFIGFVMLISTLRVLVVGVINEL